MADLSAEQDEAAYVASYSGTLENTVRRRVAYVRSRIPPGSRILDFGAGFGYIARGLCANGYHVTALERSANAVASMRAAGTHVVHELDELHAERFDAITMWHVLEHIDDPLVVLRRLRSLLRQDGAFIVAVPNAAGLFARASFEHWIWTLPWHLHYFTPRSLRTLLERVPCTVHSLEAGVGDVAALECAVGEVLLRRPSRLRVRKYEHGAENGQKSLPYRAATTVLRPLSAIIQHAARAAGLGEELVAHATPVAHDL